MWYIAIYCDNGKSSSHCDIYIYSDGLKYRRDDYLPSSKVCLQETNFLSRPTSFRNRIPWRNSKQNSHIPEEYPMNVGHHG
jgi:hypothetical protein